MSYQSDEAVPMMGLQAKDPSSSKKKIGYMLFMLVGTLGLGMGLGYGLATNVASASASASLVDLGGLDCQIELMFNAKEQNERLGMSSEKIMDACF